MLLSETKKFEPIDYEKQLNKSKKKGFEAADIKKHKKPFKALDFKSYLKNAPVATQKG